MNALITETRVSVPSYKSREVSLPLLIDVPLEFTRVIEKGRNGTSGIGIKNARREGCYVLSFPDPMIGKVIELEFYDTRGGVVAPAPVEKKAVAVKRKKKKVAALVGKKGRKWRSPLRILQQKQIQRSEDYAGRIQAIREKDISIPGLAGKNVLTIDHTGCLIRGLGIIQLAKQLEFQLGSPLHRFYDLICAQGDGAVIAGAIASGIPFNDLGKWWLDDWARVFRPGIIRKTGRWLKGKIVPNQSGYDAGSAEAALRRLFSLESGVDNKLSSVLCPLHITVVQADMNISYHRSQSDTEVELYAAVVDSAVTKDEFNQRETIKGEALFLGAVEKNDVMGLVLSPENEGISVTSIGAPVRIDPEGAKKLGKMGHAADKRAAKAGCHFLYEKRVEQIIERLRDAGRVINYHRFECAPIDGTVSNSTAVLARQAGFDSGAKQLELPEWLTGRSHEK